MTLLLSVTQLGLNELLLSFGAVFVAGIVRGFSGFALSAFVIACLATIIPPIELIPVCWFMELSASLFMFRDAFRDGNRRVAVGLVIGGSLGLPLGLYFTNSVPTDVSQLLALTLVMVLSFFQLIRTGLFFSGARSYYGAGFLAGTATGIASLGGMVVALYMLSRDDSARIIRATLVMYLLLGSLIFVIFLGAYGMMTPTAIWRGIIFSFVSVLGVIVGKMLFMPRLEAYYRPFCLCLLVGLSGIGIVRLLLMS